MYGRWPLVAKAQPWLLEKYPEFRTVPAGYARIAGQAAFAFAACGDRAQTFRWVGKTLRANPWERRAYLPLCVALKVVDADFVVRWLHPPGPGLGTPSSRVHPLRPRAGSWGAAGRPVLDVTLQSA